MVTEYGADRETKLCEVDANPDEVVRGLRSKKLMVQAGRKLGARRRSQTPKYSNIRVVDHREEPQT
jgi:hypothetical protein